MFFAYLINNDIQNVYRKVNQFRLKHLDQVNDIKEDI